MHDGAPPHTYGQVSYHLNQIFPNRWMGTYGLIRWPARSPDLNPMDFFVWGYVKGLIYVQDVTDRDVVLGLIQGAFESINPAIIRAATFSVEKRIQFCLEREGQHFEQYP